MCVDEGHPLPYFVRHGLSLNVQETNSTSQADPRAPGPTHLFSPRAGFKKCATTLGFYAGPRIQVFMLVRQLVTKPFPQPRWLLLCICTEVRISSSCLGTICVAEANGCSQLYVLLNTHMRVPQAQCEVFSMSP